MDEGTRTSGPGVSEQRSPAEIRADIDETRRELGDTVEQLARKTDVKAQVQAKRVPIAVVGGIAVVAVVAFIVLRR